MVMRRWGFRIGVLSLTFVIGVVASGVVKRVFDGPPVLIYSCGLPSQNSPRFISEGSLLEPDYQIYRFRTPDSHDPEQIILFNDFRSAEVTRYLFNSNATTSAADLIERGDKFAANGKKIGQRGITKFAGSEAVRIFWTEGDVFWALQAPSLELAREFEQSEAAQSITTSDNRPQRTQR